MKYIYKNRKKLLVIIGSIIIILSGILFFRTAPILSVVFDSQGGSLIAAKQLKKFDIIEKPVDPIMPGYIFKGWYIKDTNDLYDFNKPIEKSIILVAKWESIVKKKENI